MLLLNTCTEKYVSKASNKLYFSQIRKNYFNNNFKYSPQILVDYADSYIFNFIMKKDNLKQMNQIYIYIFVNSLGMSRNVFYHFQSHSSRTHPQTFISIQTLCKGLVENRCLVAGSRLHQYNSNTLGNTSQKTPL